MLSFSNGPITAKHIMHGRNPFLDDIRSKIKDPSLVQGMLSKSLLLRSTQKPQVLRPIDYPVKSVDTQEEDELVRWLTDDN